MAQKSYLDHLQGKSDNPWLLGLPRWTWIVLAGCKGLLTLTVGDLVGAVVDVAIYAGIVTGLFYLGYRKELAIEKQESEKKGA